MTRKRAEKQKDNESCEKKKESLQCSTDGPDTEAFSGSGEVCFNGLSRPTRDAGDTSGTRRVRMTRFVVLTLVRQEILEDRRCFVRCLGSRAKVCNRTAGS